MIDKIEIRNFKCFKKADIECASLTLLTGLNGTGKSSVIQTLLVAKQTISALDKKVHFNGYWTELGVIQDVISFFEDKQGLQLGVKCNKEGEFNIRISSIIDEEKTITVSEMNGPSEECNLLFQKLSYVCADRWGPRHSLPMSIENEVPRHVGRYGEYVAHYLSTFGERKLANKDLPVHDSNASRLLIQQTNAWLSEISPGVRLNAQVIPQVSAGYSLFSFEAGEHLTPDFKSVNVGFGLSYTLPVIVALLSAEPGDTLLLENPEAHLHPAGQTALGTLISIVANSGVQVIVETHSDHLVDGVRIAVKEEKLLPENSIFHFFHKNDSGESVFSSPKINSDGRIKSWPDGFFDQGVLNLARLNSPRRKS